MDSAFKVIFSKKTFFIIGGLSIVAFLVSLYNRYIYIDDAWFGEQAYWLARDGIVKAVSIRDFFDWDTHLLVYHKLHIIIGALLIKIFGWSVTPLRVFNLLVLLFFVFTLSQYFQKRKSIFINGETMIALFFVAINPLLALYGYTYRPEILVMTFGFISYILLDRYLTEEKKQYRIIFAGIFSGLSFFTHLNGMIFGMAGFILLLWYRMYKQGFIFGLFTIVIAAFYFYDLLPLENFHAFLYQMANFPDSQGSQYFNHSISEILLAIFSKLADEHMRFFWSYKVWGFSALFILLTILNFSFLAKKHKQLLIYLFALIICLNVFGSQIAERFLLLFLPYMIIIISIGIGKLISRKNIIFKSLVLILLALNIAGLVMVFQDIFKRNGDSIAEHSQIMAQIPDDGSSVLVNYAFVFDELKNCDLITYKTFEYDQVRLKKTFTQTEFFNKSVGLHIEYIVVPPDMTIGDDSRFPFLCDGIIDENPLYFLWRKDADYLILKRK